MTRRLIGIGNPDRGDDGVGWLVASGVTSWEASRVMAGSFDLIAAWEEDDEVVIVDAMRSGRPPGSVVRIDATVDDVRAGTFASTHSFGPSEIVALAKTMGRLPRTFDLIGIEAGTLAHGAALSSDVATAATALVKELDHA